MFTASSSRKSPRAGASRYRIGPASPDDAIAVSRLTTARDVFFGLEASTAEDLVRESWNRPGFELASDAWVVSHPSGLAGYAEVSRAGSSRLAASATVHPKHLGRGIGTALARAMEARATAMARGAATLRSTVVTNDGRAADLLSLRGYQWARRLLHMEVRLPKRDRAVASEPPGIRLRRVDPDEDLPAVHRLLESVFAGTWLHSPITFDEFLDQNVRRPLFDPDLWIVAMDGATPVGVNTGIAYSDRGWISDLGVLDSHRRRGIATALLEESFAAFARRGLTRVRLNVDAGSSTGALELYERSGMQVAISFDLWAKTLAGARGG